MATPRELSARLRTAVVREIVELEGVTDSDAAVKKGSAWSRKEELGHLVDSATNNHGRFVRATLDPPYRGPSYSQDEWVRLHGYQEMPWPALTRLWHDYNLLLAHLVERIPAAALESECAYGGYGPHTLGFVIDDYILHMQHHLDHILRREVVTRYPRT